MPRRLVSGDAGALGAVGLALVAISAVSWRRWGVPSFDAGLDLSVADLVAHGGVAYRDARYFYGPAGLYALALAFKVFGSSLTVAFAFGYVQTLAILGSFYVLARTWLAPITAGLATVLLLTIAFSGTFFDFVLPHTDAGTFGCLFLVLELLALTRRRNVLAGLAGGVAILTRPEFAAFAAATAAGAVLGHLRETGWRTALRVGVSVLVPAVVVAGSVLAGFADAAGAHRLFFENLIPVDFARREGSRLQGGWAPFDFASLVATAARAAIYGGLSVGLLASVLRWRERRGAARLAALWPLAAAVLALAALWGIWHVTGVFSGTRHEIQEECRRLQIAMAWLPLPAAVGLVWAARRALRNEPPPGIGWPADLALLAGAAASGLRAYNLFDIDSYAPYYAALPVLVAAILQERIGLRWPGARAAARGVIAIAALALAAHAYFGQYRKDGARVATPRGAYRGFTVGGAAIQRTTGYVHSQLRDREPILVLPDDPGIHFLSAHPSALYELTFLPGTLDSLADERAAIRRLQRSRPRLVVIGAQRSQNFGAAQIGVDYNRTLFRYVTANYRPVVAFGDVAHPERDNMPARAFTVWERRGAQPAGR